MDAPYTIQYDTSSAVQAAQHVDVLSASVQRLDVLVDAIKPKLKDFAKNTVGPVNKLIDRMTVLNQQFDKLNASCNGSAARLATVDNAARSMATQLGAAGKAITGTSGRLNNMQRQANAAGTATRQAAANVTALGNAAAAASPHLNTANAATRGINATSKRASVSVGGLINAYAGINIATQGMQVGRKIFHGLVSEFDQARQYAHETATEIARMRDGVAELKATLGNGTTTTQATDQVLNLMLQSGTTFDQAKNFNTMWESTIPAAKQKAEKSKPGEPGWKLNDADTQEAKAMALRFATATGMPAQKMAELVPTIGISEEVKTVDDVLGKLGAMTTLAIEGVGHIDQIMAVEQKLRGSMVRAGGGGATKSGAELMAIISAATTNEANPAASRQSIFQAWRELSISDSEKKTETFKKYGIEPGKDDFLSSITKIKPLLDEAKANGESEGQAMFNAGFKNKAANEKIIKLATDVDVLRNRVVRSATLADAGAVRAYVEKDEAENPHRKVEAAVKAASIRQNEKQYDADALKGLAEADLKNRGELGVDNSRGMWNKVGATLTTLGGLKGPISEEAMKEAVVNEIIGQKAPGAHVRSAIARMGVDPSSQLAGDLRKDNSTHNVYGSELAKLVQSLTPEEKKAVYAEAQRRALAIPARQGSMGMEPGAGPAVPGAAQGAGLDPNIQIKQLEKLTKIADAVAGPQQKLAPNAALVPAPVAGGPGGPVRK